MTTAMTAPHILQVMEPFEIQEIQTLGNFRTRENLGKTDAAHYSDPTALQPNHLADIASVTCERAVAKALGLYPTAASAWKAQDHARYRGLPDVGKNTEVKRVRDATTTTFPIHRKDMEANRVMVVCHLEGPDRVRILGWIRAVKAVDYAGTVWNDRGYWRAPISILGFIGHEDKVVGRVDCEGMIHPDCEVTIDAQEGDGRLCLFCYSKLLPWSPSNRLLRDEYGLALENYRLGLKPPAVHDPILDGLRNMFPDVAA